MGITLKDSPICWTEIWSNIYKAKMSLEIESAIYLQIHLGFYSQYLLVRSGALNNFVFKLCGKLVHGQNHWILHCETLFMLFQPLISELDQAEIDQNKLVFRLQEKCN